MLRQFGFLDCTLREERTEEKGETFLEPQERTNGVDPGEKIFQNEGGSQILSLRFFAEWLRSEASGRPAQPLCEQVHLSFFPKSRSSAVAYD